MNDCLLLGRYVESDKIFESIKAEVGKPIPTCFEGKINIKLDENEFRTIYIDELEVYDVINRLIDRKVRIEVIDEE